MSRRYSENENNFTLLRLLLALMVVLGHFKLLSGTEHAHFPFNFAGGAVDCFFVVSGFLIALSYERSHDLWAFYVRRIFRIYPMYVCVVLVQTAILLSLLPGGPFSAPESTLRYLGANLLMANFLQYDIGGTLQGLPTPGINPSLWTLKIELGFYLIAPLIMMAVRRWGWQVLGIIFVASVTYEILATQLVDVRFARQLPGQMQFFVVGMAFLYLREPIRLPPAATILIVASFFIAWSYLRFIPPGISPLLVGAFVYAFAFCTPVVPMRHDLSYSVYLLHAPLLQTLILLHLFHDNPLFLAGVLVTVLSYAALSEIAVERPGIAFGHKLARMLQRRVPIGPSVA
jgi:peptidoglycan/LPS O-acetylase OafA/YrhL